MPPGLHKEDYYHGLLPRLDAEDLLLSTGDCIIRLSHDSSSASHLTDKHYILSVCVEPGTAKVIWRRPGFEPLPKIVKHVLVHRTADGRYCIGHDYFDCIPSLIAYYTTAPIINKNIHANPLFLTPIGRQSWELEADEIAVGRTMRSGKTRDINFGTLHAAHSKAEIEATIKVIKPHEMRKEAVKEMMHEVRSLLACRSPHIMRLHGVTVLAEPCMMVMEQASEFLSSYLERYTTMTEATKIDLCYQCSLSISYAHSLDFVVRNIAARNFFCCSGKVKFGDFSLARRLQQEVTCPSPASATNNKSALLNVHPSASATRQRRVAAPPHSRSHSVTPPSSSFSASASASSKTAPPTTPTASSRSERERKPSFRDTSSSLALPIRWRAPECLAHALYSQKSDVWAFGVLCWEIYHAGRVPLPGMNSGEVQHFILTGQHLPFESIAPRVKEYITDKIFAENPDDRYVMEETAKMLEFFLALEGKKSSQEKTDSKEKVAGASKEKDNSKEKEKVGG